MLLTLTAASRPTDILEPRFLPRSFGKLSLPQLRGRKRGSRISIGHPISWFRRGPAEADAAAAEADAGVRPDEEDVTTVDGAVIIPDAEAGVCKFADGDL